MAKAYYSCAQCNVLVKVSGRNRKEADRYAEWKESQEAICSDCWKAEKAEQHAADAEENADSGLPELTGSSKQVAWAETIRKQKLEAVERWLNGDSFEIYHGRPCLPAGRGYQPVLSTDDHRTPAAIEALKEKTEASWWIDWRDAKAHALLTRIAAKMELEPEQSQAEKEAAKEAEREAKIEATVRPEHVTTETIAEVRVKDETLSIIFPEKREDFRGIVKFQLGYRWAGSSWERTINPIIHGTISDRAAEAGHILLGAGFPVRIFNESIRMAAIAGSYQSEQKKWVLGVVSGKYEGWFAFRWPREMDYYRAARLIDGSRYESPNVIAPPEQYEEVLDFAETHGFSISPKAQQMADRAREEKKRALIADVKKTERPKKEEADIKPKKLNVPESVEVDDELRDD